MRSGTAAEIRARVAEMRARIAAMISDLDAMADLMVADVAGELAGSAPTRYPRGTTPAHTDPIDIPCPSCGAMPGSTCDPRGGSYEATGRGLVHSERAKHARQGAAPSLAAAGREPVWCGVHQCWDDDCTKPRPVEVIRPVNMVAPPADGVWQDDDPLDEHESEVAIEVTGDRAVLASQLSPELAARLKVSLSAESLDEVFENQKTLGASSVSAPAPAQPPVEQPQPTGNDGGLK